MDGWITSGAPHMSLSTSGLSTGTFRLLPYARLSFAILPLRLLTGPNGNKAVQDAHCLFGSLSRRAERQFCANRWMCWLPVSEVVPE